MRRYGRGRKRVSAEKASAQGEFIASAYGQRHAVSLDANHLDLVAHAQGLGGYFVRVGPLEGWLWCPRLGMWRPVEIKIPAREGLANEYTPQQKRFMRWCLDHGAPWLVWRDRFDVETSLGAVRTA